MRAWPSLQRMPRTRRRSGACGGGSRSAAAAGFPVTVAAHAYISAFQLIWLSRTYGKRKNRPRATPSTQRTIAAATSGARPSTARARQAAVSALGDLRVERLVHRAVERVEVADPAGRVEHLVRVRQPGAGEERRRARQPRGEQPRALVVARRAGVAALGGDRVDGQQRARCRSRRARGRRSCRRARPRTHVRSSRRDHLVGDREVVGLARAAGRGRRSGGHGILGASARTGAGSAEAATTAPETWAAREMRRRRVNGIGAGAHAVLA